MLWFYVQSNKHKIFNFCRNLSTISLFKSQSFYWCQIIPKLCLLFSLLSATKLNIFGDYFGGRISFCLSATINIRNTNYLHVYWLLMDHVGVFLPNVFVLLSISSWMTVNDRLKDPYLKSYSFLIRSKLSFVVAPRYS